MIVSETRLPLEPRVFKEEYSDDDISMEVPVSHNKRPIKRSRTPFIGEDENDDDDERTARRRSRFLEPHPATANSPRSSDTTVKQRPAAAAPRGISQAQIGEHYGNCIRLAAENKITAKNAFNLHLIDFMSEMLQKEDFVSFQVASSSLDAGAKIYAGRVDAVHQETYQVLTGLGRSDKPSKQNGEEVNGDGSPRDMDEEDEADGESGQAKPGQRKKTSVQREIIQKQLPKIRSKALAAKADVDPLFQHQSAAYDEGGTAELRLNQLSTLGHLSELILDSSTRIWQPLSPSNTEIQPVDVAGIMDQLSVLAPKSVGMLTVCPSLQNFQLGDQDEPELSLPSYTPATVPPETPRIDPTDWIKSATPDVRDVADDFSDLPINDDTLVEDAADDDDNETLPAIDHITADVYQVEGGTTTIGADSELFVSSLKSMLEKNYEHFGQMNDHLLGMWAGPEHWRKKAKRRKYLNEDGQRGMTGADVDDADSDTDATVKMVGKSRKGILRSKRMKPVRFIYDEVLSESENRTRSGNLTKKDWAKQTLSVGATNVASANATVFKEQYRQKVSRQSNLLPSDLTESRQMFYQLFEREVTLESNIQKRVTPGANDQLPSHLDQLDGGLCNANGDLCPTVGWADLASETRRAVEDGLADDGGDDFDELNDGPISLADDDENFTDLPFGDVFTQPIAMGLDNFGGMIGDMEMVAQPNKVARIEIGYARTAKIINIRNLKSAMWCFLEISLPPPELSLPPRSPLSLASTSSAPDAVSIPSSVCGEQAPLEFDVPRMSSDEQGLCVDAAVSHANPPGSKSTSTRCFSELLDSLSERISWHMAKELSISIALNCLLHLSNEKQLFLECSDNLSDIVISQGMPTCELEKLQSYNSEMNNDDADAQDAPLKRPRTGVNRTGKVKRYRPSTLDSWLVDENDD